MLRRNCIAVVALTLASSKAKAGAKDEGKRPGSGLPRLNEN